MESGRDARGKNYFDDMEQNKELIQERRRPPMRILEVLIAKSNDKDRI